MPVIAQLPKDRLLVPKIRPEYTNARNASAWNTMPRSAASLLALHHLNQADADHLRVRPRVTGKARAKERKVVMVDGIMDERITRLETHRLRPRIVSPPD